MATWVLSHGFFAQYGPLAAVHPVSSLLSIGAKQMRFPYVRAVFRGRLPEWFLAEVAIEEVTETRFAVDTVESTTDCLNDPLFMHRPTLNLQF